MLGNGTPGESFVQMARALDNLTVCHLLTSYPKTKPRKILFTRRSFGVHIETAVTSMVLSMPTCGTSRLRLGLFGCFFLL